MKKRLSVLVAFAVASAIAVVVATSGGAQPGPQTLVFIERGDEGSFTFIDNPPLSRTRGERTRISPGDTFVSTTPLYNETNTTRVGSFHAECTATRSARNFGRATFQCVATFVLSDGSMLSAQAALRLAQETVSFSITGGTGTFAGRDGSGISEQIAGGNTRDTITLP